MSTTPLSMAQVRHSTSFSQEELAFSRQCSFVLPVCILPGPVKPLRPLGKNQSFSDRCRNLTPYRYQLNPPYSTNFTSQTSSHYRPYAGPTNIRYNSRVKIETPTAAPYKKQSPSKKGDNVPSPADSNESSILSAGLGNLSLKTSPTNSSG